jgi:FtsZ-binding cell division protein ZapB
MLTAKEAADQVGKTKAGILKAIKTGRLSGNKDDNGEWRIDPAELFRVYQHTPTDSRKSEPAHSTETAGLAVELAAVRDKIATLEQERQRERHQLEGQIDDIKQDRDFWRQQATALLTDQSRKAAAEPEQPAAKGIRGFLHRLTG